MKPHIYKCHYSKVPCYKCKYHPKKCGIYNNPFNPGVAIDPEKVKNMFIEEIK